MNDIVERLRETLSGEDTDEAMWQRIVRERREAADAIVALRHLSDIALERETTARREGIKAAEKAAIGERITKDSAHACLLMDEPHWSDGYNDGCDDCAAAIRTLLTKGSPEPAPAVDDLSCGASMSCCQGPCRARW